MEFIVFLIVRTESTRLPKKALRKINEKPLIKILIDRINKIENIQKFVVCTTDQHSDDELVDFLQKNRIEVFRGDKSNILKRILNAAKKYGVKNLVVIEGDDIFCEPELIKETCFMLNRNEGDYIHWELLPFGVSPIGIKIDKLEALVKNKDTKIETGWGQFVMNSGFFDVCKVKPKNDRFIRPEIRLTIDYEEDFKLAEKIFENLKEPFTLINIIELIDKKPELLKINETAKKKNKINLEQKTKEKIIENYEKD